MKEFGVEIEEMQNYGGTTSLKSKIISEEVTHFDMIQPELFVIVFLSIITFASYIMF